MPCYLGGMNYIDIILIVVLGLAAWRGVQKGLIIEIFSILALFAGIYGAIHFSDYLGVWLRDELQLKKEWLPLASFAGTFILIVIGIHLLARVISKFVDMVSLSWANKLAGAVFAVMRAALIISIVLMFVTPFTRSYDLPPKRVMNESLLYAPVAGIAPAILPMIKETEIYRYLEKEGWLPWEKEPLIKI